MKLKYLLGLAASITFAGVLTISAHAQESLTIHVGYAAIGVDNRPFA